MSDRKLTMVFKNSAGKNATISLADPKDNLTNAEVNGFMDQLITANILQASGSDITGKVSASVIETKKTEIAVG